MNADSHVDSFVPEGAHKSREEVADGSGGGDSHLWQMEEMEEGKEGR